MVKDMSSRGGPHLMRLHEIDWLRVLAMLTIFLFHCARFFNYEDWHVKNTQLSLGLTLFAGFVAQWIMPLFFVLSAFASYNALSHRTAGRYVGERFMRLVVPLVFGMFVVIAPLQVWIERASHAQYDGSFLGFYPRYFEGLYGFGGNFAWMGLHLWYLEMLFLFSVITLPLFLKLRKQGTSHRIERLSSFCSRGVNMAMFVLPVAVTEAIVGLQPEGIGMRRFGGWSVMTYLVVFILGYIAASNPAFMLAMQRQRRRLLALGIASALFLNYMYFGGGALGWSVPDESEPLLRAMVSWCIIAAILGYGNTHLGFNRPVLAYANELVLPFYILHQTVIVALGFYIAGFEWGIPLKFAFIAAVSFFIILSACHLIRKFNALRFLFGMRPIQRH